MRAIADQRTLVAGFEAAALAEVVARTTTAESRRKYAGDLRAWLRFCDERRIDPRAPTALGAAAWREVLQGRSAPATVARQLAVLSSLYRRLTARGEAASNPFDGDALPRPPSRARRPHPAVERADVERMIVAAERDSNQWRGARDAALLRLLYWTGLRRSEAARLRCADVHHAPDGCVVSIVRKGGVPGELKLPTPAVEALRLWETFRATTSGPVFPARAGADAPLSSREVGRVVERVAAAAGLSGISAHQFRARAATDLLDVVPVQVAQAFLGHASPSTTMRYDRSRIRGDAAAAALEQARR